MDGNAVKKTALASAAIMLFIIVACPTARLATANPIPYPNTPSTELPTLTIRTPKNYSDYYANNTFKLEFIIIQPESWNSYYRGFIPIIGSYGTRVYLDGNANWNLQRSPRSNTVTDYAAIFSNLTDTEHVVHLLVEAMASYMGYFTRDGETISTGLTNNTFIAQSVHFQLEPDSKTVSFQIDPQAVSRDPYPDPPTPVPIMISPQNTSYTADGINQFTLPLSFAINATASWIGYSLDNQSRITVHGNSTLSELSLGSHNITLFASGTFGNMGVSNITYFIIETKPTPEPEPLPTILLTGSATTVAALVGLGFLVYLKKRHKDKSP